MQHLKTIVLVILSCIAFYYGQAQAIPGYDEVNNKSYTLYQQGNWKELLSYGKEAAIAGQDFTLLRLRMAYAAFMMDNFSEAIHQYEKVLKNDSYNATAHYYTWLCRKYLNQQELADAELKYFSKEDLQKEKQNKIAITGIGAEVSIKSTDIAQRGSTSFEKMQLKNRFGFKVNMYQAYSLFHQTIKMPAFPPTIINPTPPLKDINISQKEYYNKITVNAAKHWQAKAAYHFIYTPLDNVTYNNQTVLAGIKYFSSYFDVQANAIFSNMYDSSISQFEVQAGYYPLGNLKLYGFSTAIVRNRPSGSAMNFRQVLGAKVLNWLWLEGNITLGSFNDLFENDALYVYNAIDKNLFKGGCVAYVTITSKCTAELGYTLEQRELLGRKTQFNQNSITGGISWKF
jgi:hypothetical protein